MPYKLITPPTLEPIDLDQAKMHLRVDGYAEDDYIESLIMAARMQCESITQRAIMPQTWEYSDDDFDEELPLAYPPLISVTSVKYLDAFGVDQTLNPALYVVDDYEEPACIERAFQVTWPVVRDTPNSVKVRYTAGYANAAAVPAPIKQWILLAIGDMYAVRERSADRPAVTQGFADGLLDAYRIYG